MSLAISIKNTEARPQTRNLVGDQKSLGAKLADSFFGFIECTPSYLLVMGCIVMFWCMGGLTDVACLLGANVLIFGFLLFVVLPLGEGVLWLWERFHGWRWGPLL